MPKLMNQSASLVAKTVSNFGFSGKRPEDLGASEYTLAGIEVDVSGSISGFENELSDALRVILDASKKNPRSGNMMLRVESFDDNLTEIHGYNELKDLDPSQYSLTPGGSTALYDATLAGLESLAGYGKQLYDLDFQVNAILFVITDGAENVSRTGTTAKILAAKKKIQQEEKIESIKTILIGVGDSNYTQSYLDKFKQDAGFDDFIWIGSATANALAKMANFISRSISSSSQALGTGSPSKNLTF